MGVKTPNNLIGQHSPYLLQHAYNPVNWYPWGQEALHRALNENRLMVISIGYAACHWCHVMEHESFEDSLVSEAMNRNYISIKVDREERPDVDQLYMTACQVLSGRGGWPLNIIALPDQRPVFAGTYFSKNDWISILDYYADMYRFHRAELEQQAVETEQVIKKALKPPLIHEIYAARKISVDQILRSWEAGLDFHNGGTLGAPKFPMPAALQTLLFYGFYTKDEKISGYINLTLTKMAMGGIYDQVGGGFARYSVDGRWHIPHFEKMLYDNAQLLSLYANFYLFSKNTQILKILGETVNFLDKELSSPEGLYYSSLDADSEGQEGIYYGWSDEELDQLLSEDGILFKNYYSCSSEGNWAHGLNVLRVSEEDKMFCARYGLSGEQLNGNLGLWKSILAGRRITRIRPATDIKVLTAWNGLMISGFVDTYRATGNFEFLDKAQKMAEYYRKICVAQDGSVWRTTSDEGTRIPGFLDDYAFIMKAFLDLYQATFNHSWLSVAGILNDRISQDFSDKDGIFFRLGSGRAQSLIHETFEISDNVVPSSNAQMALNLFIFGVLTGRGNLIARSEKMLQAVVADLRKNPGFHYSWFNLLRRMEAGPVEVTIIGENAEMHLQEFRNEFLPDAIFSGSRDGSELHPFAGKFVSGETLIYICRAKACYPAVKSVKEALLLLA